MSQISRPLPRLFNNKNKQRVDWLWLIGTLLVALGLRCIALNAGLWYDEIGTLVAYVRLPTTQLMTTYTSFNNHILYSLLAKLTTVWFGESAWALRLPAVLFGVASIAAFWWLAVHVVSRWEARFAALLMAVSYHHVWFSQNARGYTGLLFFTLIATTLLLKELRQPSRRLWVAYAVVFVGAMYIHLSAAFIFAAHALTYGVFFGWGWLRRRSWVVAEGPLPGLSQWGPLWGFILGGGLTLAIYAAILPQLINAFSDMAVVPVKVTISHTEWKNPLWTLLEVLRNLSQHGVTSWLALPLGGA